MKNIEINSKKEITEKNLTKKQLALLKLVYRFRFVTSKNIAAYFKQSYLRVARVQLNKLCERSYLAKRYDSSYRLQNRPAEYYLTPKATPILRTLLVVPNERELKQSYARPNASRRFINRSLAIFDIYLELCRLYGDCITFVTKSQLSVDRYSYLPDILPDAYFKLEKSPGDVKQFFFEYFDDEISIGIHGRKIINYMKYKEDGEWNRTGSDFPSILIVCQSPTLLRRAEKRTRYYDNQEYSDISFRLIGLDELINLDNTRKKVWSDPIEKTKTTL